jgi:hypothetical protein
MEGILAFIAVFGPGILKFTLIMYVLWRFTVWLNENNAN